MMTSENFQYWYKAYVLKIKNGPEFETISSVYDADTVTVLLSVGCHTMIEKPIRLLDIDAPEIRGEERPLGLVSKAALLERLDHKQIILNTYLDRDDKYGRLLGVIYLNGENINQWLLDNGYAKPYVE